MLKFIVTGTGRSGTLYMAKVLTALGIPCGHESVFNCSLETSVLKRYYDQNYRTLSGISMLNEISKVRNIPIPHLIEDVTKNDLLSKFIEKNALEGTWLDPSKIIADSSYMAMPYLSHECIKSVPVIHIIRNPFAVISSFVLDFKYFADEHDEYQTWIYEQLPSIKDYKNAVDRACAYYIEWNLRIEEQCLNRPYIRINVQNTLKDNFFNFIGT